jgi:hypothetical protein
MNMDLLIKKVLNKDYIQAGRLVDCIVYCGDRYDEALEQTNVVAAKRWLEEQRRSLDELEELFKKKEQHDRVRSLVEELQGRNIHIQLINITV